MKISIIIVSWNVREDLVKCLDSIYKNPPSKKYEIVIVDNASADDTVKTIKNDYKKVVVIENKTNSGFSAANNLGIKKTSGQYLFLLNPDTIVCKNSIDVLAEILDKYEDAGACGPRLFNPDGTDQIAVGSVPTFRALLYGKTILRSLGIFRRHYKSLKHVDFDYEKQAEMEQLSGAAVMVRSSVIKEIGLMDETFFMYYEDIDLFLRIRKAGWKLLYVPAAKIIHSGGKSSDQVSWAKHMMMYESLFIFLKKHKGKFQTWLFGLLFKPLVILKEIENIFSSLIILFFSLILRSRKRQRKAINKLRLAGIFLYKYSLKFLFSI